MNIEAIADYLANSLEHADDEEAISYLKDEFGVSEAQAAQLVKLGLSLLSLEVSDSELKPKIKEILSKKPKAKLREKDIKHEIGDFWVADEGDSYVVYKQGGTHSASDSAYPHDEDGLSIAIARANYLAKRKGQGMIKEEQTWPQMMDSLEKIIPDSQDKLDKLSQMIDEEGHRDTVYLFTDGEGDPQGKGDQDMPVPYWVMEGIVSLVQKSRIDSAKNVVELMKLAPELKDWLKDEKNLYLSWGESGGMMPYGDANYPNDAVLLEIWGEGFDLHVELPIDAVAGAMGVPNDAKLKEWLKLLVKAGRSQVKRLRDDGNIEAYSRFQGVFAVYAKIEEFKEAVEEMIAELDGSEKEKAEELLKEIEEGAGSYR